MFLFFLMQYFCWSTKAFDTIDQQTLQDKLSQYQSEVKKTSSFKFFWQIKEKLCLNNAFVYHISKKCPLWHSTRFHPRPIKLLNTYRWPKICIWKTYHSLFCWWHWPALCKYLANINWVWIVKYRNIFQIVSQLTHSHSMNLKQA